MDNEENKDSSMKDYETNVSVRGLKCKRCGHPWIPRKAGDPPLTCPKCHSAYWARSPIRKKKSDTASDTPTE